MIGNFDVGGGHDFVDTAELEKMSLDNSRFLEAKYNGDVSVLRAKYVQKLLGHDAVHGGFGLAIFDIVAPDEGSLMTDEQPKDMLVLMQRVTPNPTDAPSLRIITNETFCSNGTHMILTQDVVIDNENDAQLFVDAIEVKNGNEISPVIDQIDTMDGMVPEAESCAPVFMISPSGAVQMANVRNYPPRYCLTLEDDGQKQKVVPQGIHKCLEDKMYALSVADDLFRAIEHIDPKLVANG